MAKYVALLRGITPSNPKLRNEKLRNVFESLGYKNVVSVISSGNIIFETQRETLGLEENHGKEITIRTWKTVELILKNELAPCR